MRPLQSCGAKSSFALPRVQVAVPLSVKSVAPPPPLPVVRVVKPRAQTSARPPLACPSVASVGKPVVVRCAPTPPPLASAAGLVVNQPEHVPSAHAGVTRRGKRKSIGSDFESHAELEAAKQAREVEELVALMPQSVAVALLGGELGLRQLPREAERKAALSDAVAFKAGSDGATLANARRAWVAYMQYARVRVVCARFWLTSIGGLSRELSARGEAACSLGHGLPRRHHSCKFTPCRPPLAC